MLKEIKWIVIWGLCLFYSSFVLLKLLYTIITSGLNVLRVKSRPVRPSILTDERYGKHHNVILDKGGIRLHYVEKGDPSHPLLIFVHGFPQCWFSWRNQMESLSNQYRVVAVDLPGYGESDKPTQMDAYYTDRLADNLKQFILAMGVSSDKPCVLISHDWGSALCWILVEKYPNLFRRHVCIDGCSLYTLYTELTSNVLQFFSSWYLFFFQLPCLPEAMLKLNDLDEYAKILRGPKNDVKAFSDEVIEAYKYYYSKKGSFTAPLNYYRRVFHVDFKEPKGKITVPTLILWGEKDMALSKEIAIKMLPLCEKVELKIVKEGLHFLPEYEPEAVTETIRLYLNTL